jgi:hypothetical protein
MGTARCDRFAIVGKTHFFQSRIQVKLCRSGDGPCTALWVVDGPG